MNQLFLNKQVIKLRIRNLILPRPKLLIISKLKDSLNCREMTKEKQEDRHLEDLIHLRQVDLVRNQGEMQK